MADNRPTNFFYRQDQARSNIRKLVMLFILAVMIIIAAIYFAFRLIYYIYLSSSAYHTNWETSAYYAQQLKYYPLWDIQSFFLIAGMVILFISIAGLLKMNQLQKGGGAIAEMLGGRLIPKGSSDQRERRLLNVVEEMSISSGVPVPPAYILDNEKGINAFAAGLTLHDSAIAVTRGMLEQLNRDELQGVVAHEFSHILNGDARLNTRLIGILYGILVIGIVGGKILEHHRLTRTSIVVFAAGVILAIVGYTGSFMGRLIQCAVSRQKELLADSSAVQFSRNALGLANALKKIGGYSHGSLVQSATARQASHLFISESSLDFLFPRMLATHPPLHERIRLLDPSFDGKYPKRDAAPEISKAASKYIAEYQAYKHGPDYYSDYPVKAQAENITGLVGSFSDAHIDRGKSLLALIPERFKQDLSVSQSAACVIYALFVGCENNYRRAKLDVLRKAFVPENIIAEISTICEKLMELGPDVRLPLVELAAPSLLTLTSRAKREFLRIIDLLIRADNQFTLFEFTVQWLLNKLLKEKENISGKISFFSYAAVAADIFTLLNVLAWAGNTDDSQKAKQALNAGLSRIPEIADKTGRFEYQQNISFADVGRCLDKLSASSFRIKKSVVDACAHCAFFDREVTVSESDLLRVISLALDCPLPPFFP